MCEWCGGGVHAPDPDRPSLVNCPRGPAISVVDLAIEKYRTHGRLKGGYARDFLELRRFRDHYSGKGMGDTYE
eukprot:1955191-Alexandrium_andersonii.AAC.1